VVIGFEPNVLADDAGAVTLADKETLYAWDYLNKVRVSHGLEPLKWNSAIEPSTKTHAKACHARGAIWHSDKRTRVLGARENVAVSSDESFSRPIGQWYRSDGHRRFMLDRGIKSGALGRHGSYWVFQATETDGGVFIPEMSVESLQEYLKVSGFSRATLLGTVTASKASDGQRTVKTYSRTGRPRPLRYALWRAFN
jgi:hypothetical protein